MLLQKLSDRIYYLPFAEETDRPNLGYIRGDRHSLMVDAGNSPAHVELFLEALAEQSLPLPDFCALTHWHWDHAFGIATLKTLPNHPVEIIACRDTNEKLQKVAEWSWDELAMQDRLADGSEIEFCDTHIRLEYPDTSQIRTGTADITFDSELLLDLGGIQVRLTAMDSPHSRDAVLVEIPSEQILFLGDAACEDFYDNDGKYDSFRLMAFMNRLQEFPASVVLSGHGEPETKQALLEYLTEKCQKCSTFHIRSMKPDDVHLLAASFCSQGWADREETLLHYLADQKAGTRYVYVAELSGLPVGYVTLLPLAKTGPFAGKHPEISDFNVLQLWQKQGIGSALMDAAEAQAKKLSPTVTLGVGLHSGYGSAQRMYIKRGYIPDGTGVWYGEHRAVPYTSMENDDDLILYLQKVF